MVAHLLEDQGRAATETDFFRSAEFLAAEGTTHSLLILDDQETELCAVPLLVRSIEGSEMRDAISPYGYPGVAYSGKSSDIFEQFPIDPGQIDFSQTDLVTVFVRHALGPEPAFSRATQRNLCLLSDPALPRKSRMSDRQQIRKNLKRGYELEIVPGPETDTGRRDGFFTAYTETMTRTSAADRYFFSTEYFERILSAESTWLVLARAPDGQIAAGSIAARSDGLLHYYLSGTADSHLRDSPMKNVIEAMIEFGAELDLPVSFGGGIRPGDALETFKRGFANREERFATSEIICDPVAADQLTAERDRARGDDRDPGFFPAYRAPAV